MNENVLHRVLWPSGIAIGTLILLLLLRGIIFRYWMQWAKNHPHPFAKAARELLKTPSFYWCIAIAIYVSLDFAELGPVQTKQLGQLIYITLILSVSLVLSNVAVSAFRHFVGFSNGLMIGLVKASVWSIGILVTLSVLGISIAPILTALGVGGLAVALALKDTLENLFAGIYLISEGALRVGDVVRLESGIEGVIQDFGWRTTRIKLGSNNMTLVPNSKLAQNIVTNFSLPEKKFVVGLPINVSDKAEIAQVEKILLELGRKATEDVVGVLSVPEPTVVFNGPGAEGGLAFTFNFWVREYREQASAANEMRKRVYYAFKSANIPLPQKELFVTHTAGQVPSPA